MFDRPLLDLSDPGVRTVLTRLGPAIFGIAVYYVDVIVARHLLSELELGSTSYFTFALRLCDFPQGIFIMALQAATLPSLSRLAAQGDLDELGKTVAFGLRLSLFVALPATVLFVVLAEPLVITIFQRGHFDARASTETARALMAQGIGIWMVAGVRQLVSTYYALGDTRTPVIVSALDFTAFVLLALALRPGLGHVGVSWAVSGASLVQLLLLWTRLARRVPSMDTAGVLRSGATTLLASVPAALFGWAAARVLAAPGAGALGRALPGIASSIMFLLVFLVSARLLKHKELDMLWRAVRRRVA